MADPVSDVPRYHKQEQEPAAPEVTEVAADVLRMQLPIRMPGLGHVNAYAITDDRGAAVVDPGVPGPGNWKALVDRLRQGGLRVSDVHTVVVTHSHIDHFGTAARLAKTAAAAFVVHEDFAVPWLGVSQHACVGNEHAPAQVRPDWDERTPWGGDPIRPSRRRRTAFWLMRTVVRRAMMPPVPSERIAAGHVLKLGGREWFAVHTPGHTLDHLCLHDPESGTLISGDHVLPTITPHIAGVGTGPDPLRDFLASLDAVAALPAVQSVLPAHGHPFDDLMGRVEEIKTHHNGRLERLRQYSREFGRAASVREFSEKLFRPARWGPMAESETFAHLEHLRHRGEAERTQRGDKFFFLLA